MIIPPLNDNDANAVRKDILLSYLNRQVEAGKWLLASLLLINGGAIAGLLSSENMPEDAMAAGAKSFITGLVLAFASGVFSWGVADGYIALLRNQLGVFLNDDDKKITKFAIPMTSICAFVSFTCMFGSLGFFSYGALNVASVVQEHASEKAEAERAAALQKKVQAIMAARAEREKARLSDQSAKGTAILKIREVSNAPSPSR